QFGQSIRHSRRAVSAGCVQIGSGMGSATTRRTWEAFDRFAWDRFCRVRRCNAAPNPRKAARRHTRDARSSHARTTLGCPKSLSQRRWRHTLSAMTIQGGETQQVNLHQLLKAMIEKGASDLHITTGTPPQLRIDDSLVPLRLPP